MWSVLQRVVVFVTALVVLAPSVPADELFASKKHTTHWATPENPSGTRGSGGRENKGAKGRAFVPLLNGQTLVLADVRGSGVIRRLWMTIDKRVPKVLRGVKIEMFWDGAERPAVSVPLGDYFGMGHGRFTRFHSALFSSPEARSFNAFVPMPFRSSARIVLTNESGVDVDAVFYEVNYELGVKHDDSMLYFHAHWRRDAKTQLGEDFEVLPRIEGLGRYLATNVSVNTSPEYFNTGWQEGEFKFFLDADRESASLVGTGTEDYIGSGWGQGVFDHLYQGSTIANMEARQWAFYRQHVPDPIYFSTGIRVTLQQIGGGYRNDIATLLRTGIEMKPISVAGRSFIKLLEEPSPRPILEYGDAQSWVNFYRRDDVAATSYFYLSTATNSLPRLQPVAERIAGLPEV